MTKYLFAYGTLRLNNSLPIAKKLASVSELIGLGYIKGAKLFKIDSFPGIVDGYEDEDIVIGDVFLVKDDELYQELDEYEGIGVGHPPYDYARKKVKVYLDDQELECWAYWFQSPLKSDAVLVDSGDYLSP